MCDHTLAHFQRAKMCECAKMWKKCEFQNRTLKRSPIALLIRANVQKCAKKVQKNSQLSYIFTHSLISKERLCNYTFFALFQRAEKCAIAHLHIFKEQKNVRLHICTFLKSKNVLCANVRLSNPAILDFWPCVPHQSPLLKDPPLLYLYQCTSHGSPLRNDPPGSLTLYCNNKPLAKESTLIPESVLYTEPSVKESTP